MRKQKLIDEVRNLRSDVDFLRGVVETQNEVNLASAKLHVLAGRERQVQDSINDKLAKWVELTTERMQ